MQGLGEVEAQPMANGGRQTGILTHISAMQCALKFCSTMGFVRVGLLRQLSDHTKIMRPIYILPFSLSLSANFFLPPGHTNKFGGEWFFYSVNTERHDTQYFVHMLPRYCTCQAAYANIYLPFNKDYLHSMCNDK